MHRVAAESYSENQNPSKRATPKGREREGACVEGVGVGSMKCFRRDDVVSVYTVKE